MSRIWARESRFGARAARGMCRDPTRPPCASGDPGATRSRTGDGAPGRGSRAHCGEHGRGARRPTSGGRAAAALERGRSGSTVGSAQVAAGRGRRGSAATVGRRGRPWLDSLAGSGAAGGSGATECSAREGARIARARCSRSPVSGSGTGLASARGARERPLPARVSRPRQPGSTDSGSGDRAGSRQPAPARLEARCPGCSCAPGLAPPGSARPGSAPPAPQLGLHAPAPRSRAPRSGLGVRRLAGSDLDVALRRPRIRAVPSCAVRITRVPHPDGSSRTVPLTCSPSQATAVSGSSLVILISPNWPRWRPSDAASLHSAHNSGGDLTSVRLASCDLSWSEVSRGPDATPSGVASLHGDHRGTPDVRRRATQVGAARAAIRAGLGCMGMSGVYGPRRRGREHRDDPRGA